jgi:DNA-binding response OmpR family regulator
MTRIIVIDDDMDICDMVQHGLTTMGMDVEVFHYAEDGLRAIVENSPDLAVVDMMMPWVNGLDVTRGIRANGTTKDLPIMILTALHMPEWREAAYEAGTDHYVTKPFSVAALGADVERLLGLEDCTTCGKQRGVGASTGCPSRRLTG